MPPHVKATLLEGTIAARAAIEGGQREVHRVWFDRERDTHDLTHLKKLCKMRGIRYSPTGRATLDEIAKGKTHGGLLCEVGERRFVGMGDLLPGGDATEGAAAPFVVMLDGIEDPFNFGQSVRALYAAGVHGVLIRPRNWTTAAAVVARASAGATERVPMAIADDPDQAADFFEPHGFRVVATGQSDDAVNVHDAELTGPLLLLIGGERRGLKRAFLQRAKQVVTIPYAREFRPALGTVAATAVLAFEAARQRR